MRRNKKTALQMAPNWNSETMKWEDLQNTYTKKKFAFNVPKIEVVDCFGQQSTRTQSVSDKIGARKRKGLSVLMKHIRVEHSRKDMLFMQEYCPQNRLLMDLNAQRTISYNIIDCPDND